MARTFQFGQDSSGDLGLQAMMTDEGTILNTQSDVGEVTVVDGTIASTVENPSYQAPEETISAELDNTLNNNGFDLS